MAVVSLKALQDEVFRCKSTSATFSELADCKEQAATQLAVLQALENRWSAQQDCDIGNIELLGLAEMASYLGFGLDDIKDIANVARCRVQRLELRDGRSFYLKRSGNSGDAIDDLEVNYQVQTIADVLNEDAPRVVWTDMNEGVIAFTDVPRIGAVISWTELQPHETVTSLVFEMLVGDHDRHVGNAYEVYDAVYGHIDFSRSLSLTERPSFSSPVTSFIGDLRKFGIEELDRRKPGIARALREAKQDYRRQGARIAAMRLKDFPIEKVRRVGLFLDQIAEGTVPDFNKPPPPPSPPSPPPNQRICDALLEQLNDITQRIGEAGDEAFPDELRWLSCHPFDLEDDLLRGITEKSLPSECRGGPLAELVLQVQHDLVHAMSFCEDAYAEELSLCATSKASLDAIYRGGNALVRSAAKGEKQVSAVCRNMQAGLASIQTVDTVGCPVQSARQDAMEDDWLNALAKACGPR